MSNSFSNLAAAAEAKLLSRRSGYVDELLQIIRRQDLPDPADAERLGDLVESLGLTFEDVKGVAALVSLLDECRAYRQTCESNPLAAPAAELRTIDEWEAGELNRVRAEAAKRRAPLTRLRGRIDARRQHLSMAGQREGKLAPALSALQQGRLEEFRSAAQYARMEGLFHFAEPTE